MKEKRIDRDVIQMRLLPSCLVLTGRNSEISDSFPKCCRRSIERRLNRGNCPSEAKQIVDLVNSDLTGKLRVADLATISVLADILGVFDVCVVCIPEPGGA